MEYYRYQESLYEHGVALNCHTYYLIKKTPKGAWIESFGYKRFVLDDAKKRFAHPTKQEALESFRARKRRQIKILKKRLQIAELALVAEPDVLTYWQEL